MNEGEIQFSLSGDRTVTGIRTQAEGPTAGWLFVYAPGTGSNVNDPFGKYACDYLAAQGIASVRFQFPYMEARKRRPDPPAELEATWRGVLGTLRTTGSKLAVGGRSMGGRIASQVVAQGEPVDALVLFAYPLHPPARPSVLRDKHLPAITTPTLFCSGTRDAFGSPEELAAAASLVSGSEVHYLEGADHGFKVAKSSGRTREDVWNEAMSAMQVWLISLDANRSS